MSVGNFLLLLFAAVGGKVVGAAKALVKLAPKALNTLARLAKPFTRLMKKGVQTLLRNKAVRTILEGAKSYLINPLEKLLKPHIKKISERLRAIKQKDVWRRIVRVSELINLDPKAGVKAAAARFGNTWIGRKVSNFEAKVFNMVSDETFINN